MSLASEIPGWFGAIFIILAFWMLTHKVVHSHSKVYFTLNLLAGILLAYDAAVHRTSAGLAINIVWIVIAVYGLGWAHKRKEAKLKR